MGIKSIWLDKEIDEVKLKKIAKDNKESVSKLMNKLLKGNYDVIKENKK